MAEYFIFKSQADGRKDLTNKKLQKLLYYSQAWNLAISDKKLFKEDFEAWVHGPAVKLIYRKYKDFGFNAISKTVDETSFKDLAQEEIELLDSVWNVYGKYDASYLELLTHSEQPWIEARQGLQPYDSSSNVISLATMRDFYRKKSEASI